MSVNNKVPEIRFKEFSGEWERLSFLDSLDRIIDFRGRTPKKLGLDWSPSGYRALSALNVKQGYIDFLIDPHFGDQELYDKWMSGSELHQGQVLFTTEAPMGNVAQVPNTDKYILSQRTIAFIIKSEIIAEDFLAVLLRSSKVFRELSALSSGGTAKGVSQKVLANLSISIPNDLAEQATIGNYFQQLDSLINQHQQKHDKLSNIKKAMLEKMFPKQGETIPEIRFNGFSGEWAENTLSEIANVIDPHPSHRAPDAVDNGVPFIGIGDISDVGLVYWKNVRIVPSHIYSEHSARYTIEKGDFAYGRVASIGKIIDLSNNVGLEYTYSPTMAIVKPTSLYPAYLRYYLQTEVFKDHVANKTSGSTRKSLGVQDFRCLPVLFPLKGEQNKIGNYFQKLDALINQHQQQIAKLNNIKQACLSKMFV